MLAAVCGAVGALQRRSATTAFTDRCDALGHFVVYCLGPAQAHPRIDATFGWCAACSPLGMSEIHNHERVELTSLAQLRDEIRVRLHLAQLDAKDKWQDLESQLASLEHRVAADGGTVLGATAQLAKELKQSLIDFRERLSA
jgi:hypothetical protein